MVANQILRDAEKNRLIAEGEKIIERELHLVGVKGVFEDGFGGNSVSRNRVVVHAAEIGLERAFRVFDAIAIKVGEDDFATGGPIFESGNTGGGLRRRRRGFAGFELPKRNADDMGVLRRKLVKDARLLTGALRITLAPGGDLIGEALARIGIVGREHVTLPAQRAAGDLFAEEL